MIGYIVGKVQAQIDKRVIVRLPSGLGYVVTVAEGEIYMQNDSFERFVLQVTRDSSSELYGFKTLEGRKWVEKFMKVSGVGPKMAATIVHSMGVDRIISAINSKDVKAFGAVKGLGAKTAKKILLELQGNTVSIHELNAARNYESKTVIDFTDTLISLGYKRGQVVQVIQRLKKENVWTEKDLKQMIRKGINYLS